MSAQSMLNHSILQKRQAYLLPRSNRGRRGTCRSADWRYHSEVQWQGNIQFGELVRAVSDSAPGARVKLQLWREGANKEVTVVLGDAATVTAAQRQRQKQQSLNNWE